MEKKKSGYSGMGVVAPNGIGLEDFWSSLSLGRSGIKKITRFDASSYPVQIAGEVQDFNPLIYMTPKRARHMDQVCSICSYLC